MGSMTHIRQGISVALAVLLVFTMGPGSATSTAQAVGSPLPAKHSAGAHLSRTRRARDRGRIASARRADRAVPRCTGGADPDRGYLP